MVNTLDLWAATWNVPQAALDHLKQLMGVDPSQMALTKGRDLETEEGVQAMLRMHAAQRGCLLWRNNVGASMDTRGRMIRYGLANESKRINDQVKSSDLIGIRPVTITQEMVGTTIGQFVALETKKPGWTYRESDTRAKAQKKFIDLVVSRGGWARFVSGIDDNVI